MANLMTLEGLGSCGSGIAAPCGCNQPQPCDCPECQERAMQGQQQQYAMQGNGRYGMMPFGVSPVHVDINFGSQDSSNRVYRDASQRYATDGSTRFWQDQSSRFTSGRYALLAPTETVVEGNGVPPVQEQPIVLPVARQQAYAPQVMEYTRAAPRKPWARYAEFV